MVPNHRKATEYFTEICCRRNRKLKTTSPSLPFVQLYYKALLIFSSPLFYCFILAVIQTNQWKSVINVSSIIWLGSKRNPRKYFFIRKYYSIKKRNF